LELVAWRARLRAAQKLLNRLYFLLLVVRGRDRIERGQRLRAAQHLLRRHRVKLDAIEFRASERAGLVPDGIGHRGRAKVVQQCGSAETGEGIAGGAEQAAGVDA
jgi:hypothetical protein